MCIRDSSNTDAVQNGQAPQFILNETFISCFTTMGGAGITIGLVIALLFASKRDDYKEMCIRDRCKITDLTKRSFANKVVEYYVLKPVYNEHSIVYIPIDNEELVSKIKRILSVEDIHELIRTLPNEDYCWIENDNQRKEKYREIIKSGNRKELMKMIRTLYLYQQELKKDGKKIHAADDKFFKDAEKVLYDEFAYVLDICLLYTSRCV